MIGTAAVMMRNGTVLRTPKYHLGSETDHTVYKAEATAEMLALHMLTGLKKKKATIGMDSQAVLVRLSNQMSKPGHHLLDEIHDALEDFQVTQFAHLGSLPDGYRKGTGRTTLGDESQG